MAPLLSQRPLEFSYTDYSTGTFYLTTLLSEAEAADGTRVLHKGTIYLMPDQRSELESISPDGELQAVRSTKDTLIYRVARLEDRIYMFYGTGAGFVESQQLDPLTLANRGEPRRIGDLFAILKRANKPGQFGHPSIVPSVDGSHLSVVNRWIDPQGNAGYQVVSVDAKMQVQYHQEVILPGVPDDYRASRYFLASDGTLYAAGVDEEARKVHVHLINETEATHWSPELSETENYVRGVSLYEDANGTINFVTLLVDDKGSPEQLLSCRFAPGTLNAIANTNSASLANAPLGPVRKNSLYVLREVRTLAEGAVLAVIEDVDRGFPLVKSPPPTEPLLNHHIRCYVIEKDGTVRLAAEVEKKQMSYHAGVLSYTGILRGDTFYMLYNEKGKLKNDGLRVASLDLQTGKLVDQLLFKDNDFKATILVNGLVEFSEDKFLVKTTPLRKANRQVWLKLGSAGTQP